MGAGLLSAMVVFLLERQQSARLALRDMSSWVARRPVYSVLSTAKYARANRHSTSGLARSGC